MRAMGSQFDEQGIVPLTASCIHLYSFTFCFYHLLVFQILEIPDQRSVVQPSHTLLNQWQPGNKYIIFNCHEDTLPSETTASMKMISYSKIIVLLLSQLQIEQLMIYLWFCFSLSIHKSYQKIMLQAISK